MIAKVGPYEIHQSLGQGTLGMVYRAVDTRTGEARALKLVRRDVLSEPECLELLARYRRDVEITGRLDLPQVLHAVDFGETEDAIYLVTELVAGGRLSDQPPGSLPADRLLGLFAQLLDGLAVLHAKGIVHRDIHPVGLLVTSDGGIKLANFGMAQGMDGPAAGTGVIGTPPYLPPEQLLGVPVDARADLYAVGATLFHAVTGRKPYCGSLAEVMAAILEAPVPRASRVNAAVPAGLDIVLLKAMAKHPDDRYASGTEFAAALRDVMQAMPATQATAAVPQAADEGMALGDGPDGLRRRIHLLLVRGIDSGFSPHLDPLRQAIAEFLASGATEQQRAALAVVLTQAAQALHDLILTNAPVPGQPTSGARCDWMDAVHLFDTVRSALVRLGQGDAAVPLTHGMARDLTVTALLYLNEVNRQVFSPDYVELAAITANLIRLDILEWALEVLNARDAVRDIRVSSRMIAGQVLRKVSATLRDFTEFTDEMARFDVASALVATEELIALADRTIQDDPELGMTGDRAYAKVLGREILNDFIEAARRLAAFTADELIAQIGEARCDMASFAGNLRQLGRLHHFSVRIEDEQCRPMAMRLTEEVRESIDSLAGEIMAALRDGDGVPDLLHKQLTAVYSVAVEQGWSQFAEELLAVLRENLLQEAAGE